MTGGTKSKKHHWWPVVLQTYWADGAGDVSWIDPTGKTVKKRAAKRNIGFSRQGHTALRGSCWEDKFEGEFEIDNKIHDIIRALKDPKPFGKSLSDSCALARRPSPKNDALRDMCRYFLLDEQLHRKLLLLIYSLLIRSPSTRFRYEAAPQMIGLPAEKDVGKANMVQDYRVAQKLCLDRLIYNQYFVLLYSPLKQFICGDGNFNQLTDLLVVKQIRGRALLPLTPHLCVYFCTPVTMRPSPNCASLSVTPCMVDRVNQITQIYSKDKLFFLGEAPTLTDAFQLGRFPRLTEKEDDLFDMLDHVAGIGKQRGDMF